MTHTPLKDIPKEDFEKMRDRVLAEVNSMSQDELEIATKSKESFAKTIGLLFQEVAKLMGYVIAYPIILAAKIAESLVKGFGHGIDKAFKDIWED